MLVQCKKNAQINRWGSTVLNNVKQVNHNIHDYLMLVSHVFLDDLKMGYD
jgi:hypothetical protein